MPKEDPKARQEDDGPQIAPASIVRGVRDTDPEAVDRAIRASVSDTNE